MKSHFIGAINFYGRLQYRSESRALADSSARPAASSIYCVSRTPEVYRPLHSTLNSTKSTQRTPPAWLLAVAQHQVNRVHRANISSQYQTLIPPWAHQACCRYGMHFLPKRLDEALNRRPERDNQTLGESIAAPRQRVDQSENLSWRKIVRGCPYAKIDVKAFQQKCL